MSKIEIINRALLKLGEPPVSSLNDAGFGRSYDLIYQDIKNLLLSSYPWRFAVATEHLAARQEKFNGRFMYQLPADCLFLVRVGEVYGRYCAENAALRYEIADNCVVLDDNGGIDVEYVKEIDDDALFPPLFREAMAAKLAAEFSMRLKHSLNFKQVFDNEFYNLIRQAELNNEIVKDVEMMPESSWMAVRHAF